MFGGYAPASRTGLFLRLGPGSTIRRMHALEIFFDRVQSLQYAVLVHNPDYGFYRTKALIRFTREEKGSTSIDCLYVDFAPFNPLCETNSL